MLHFLQLVTAISPGGVNFAQRQSGIAGDKGRSDCKTCLGRSWPAMPALE